MGRTFRREGVSASIILQRSGRPTPCRRRRFCCGGKCWGAAGLGVQTHIWAPGTAILTWLFCDRVIVKGILSICGSLVESEDSSGVSYRRWPIEGGSSKRIGGGGKQPKSKIGCNGKVWCAVALRTDHFFAAVVKVQCASCQQRTTSYARSAYTRKGLSRTIKTLRSYGNWPVQRL